MTAAAPEPGRWVFSIVIALLLTSFGLAAVVGILMLVTGDDGEALGKTVATSLIAAAFLSLSLASAMLIRRRQMAVAMVLAIFLAAAATTTWSLLLWYEDELRRQSEQALAQTGGTLTAACLLLVYTAGLRSLKTRSTSLHVMRWVVILIAWGFVSLLLLLVWHGEQIDRSFPRFTLTVLIGMMSVLGGLALLGPLVVRSSFASYEKRFAKETRAMSGSIRVTLSCPRCEETLDVPAGPARCRACGFTMTVEFEEPRCECGYLLFQLQGETCPECGRLIPPGERWPR